MRRTSRPPCSRGAMSGSKPRVLRRSKSCCSIATQALIIVRRGAARVREPNLHGMNLLDRLEDWGVRSDRLMLRGCPEFSSRK
jgi:hypothetical protein